MPVFDEYISFNELLKSEQQFPFYSQPDILGEIRDIPFWKRRSDLDWLQDVPPGLLTSAMNRACATAFQACAGQRLMLAMYDVELQARPDVLGRMFAVLRRRHGYVVREDFREGENVFIICCRLPVVESFGLAEELRSRTSGIVTLPQLRPSGWEILEIDPIQRDFTGITKSNIQQVMNGHLNKKHAASHSGRRVEKLWKSKNFINSGKLVNERNSDDDYDNKDDAGDELNAQLTRVRNYIRDVRIRKGLHTMEQLVQYADKQRTLKKNK